VPEELHPEDMRDLWQNQPREPVRIPPAQLRRKAQQFESKTRHGFRDLIAMMILAAVGYVSFLYFFSGTIPRIGVGLALAGYLYSFYRLYKRGPVGKVPEGPGIGNLRRVPG
jgi:hypothetical protein